MDDNKRYSRKARILKVEEKQPNYRIIQNTITVAKRDGLYRIGCAGKIIPHAKFEKISEAEHYIKQNPVEIAVFCTVAIISKLNETKEE